jgi:hypothetical protein
VITWTWRSRSDWIGSVVAAAAAETLALRGVVSSDVTLPLSSAVLCRPCSCLSVSIRNNTVFLYAQHHHHIVITRDQSSPRRA